MTRKETSLSKSTQPDHSTRSFREDLTLDSLSMDNEPSVAKNASNADNLGKAMIHHRRGRSSRCDREGSTSPMGTPERSKKRRKISDGTKRNASSNKDEDSCGEDDVKNLEENAALMLSSHFDPRWMSSSPEPDNELYGNSSQVDDAGMSRRLRKRSKRSLVRKRRHFYEVCPGNVDPVSILKQRIRVYWPLDNSWYPGMVKGYDPLEQVHCVKYDDDHCDEWVDLQSERFKLLLFPSELSCKFQNEVSQSNLTQDERGTGNVSDDHSSEDSDVPIISWLSSRKPSNYRSTSMKDYISRGSDGSIGILASVADRTAVLEELEILSMSVQTKQVIVKIEFRPLSTYDLASGTKNFSFLHNMFSLRFGLLVNVWPTIRLEMLLLDNIMGIRLLQFEGCLSRVVGLLCSIVTIFYRQSITTWTRMSLTESGMPFTSIRFRLSGLRDQGEQLRFLIYNFSQLETSKYKYLEEKLNQLKMSELSLADCTYSNVKNLLGKGDQIFGASVYEDVSTEGFSGKPLSEIVRHTHMGMSTILDSTFCLIDESFRKTSMPSLSFSTSPSVFMGLHLKLLTDGNVDSFDIQKPGSSPSREYADRNSKTSTSSFCLTDDTCNHVSDIEVENSGSFNKVVTVPTTPPGAHLKADTDALSSADLRSICWSRHGKPRSFRKVKAARKRVSGVSVSALSYHQSLMCAANVLVETADRGWREYGAMVVLNSAAEQWRICVTLSGSTKYEHQGQNTRHPGTTNRYTHAIMWKGGKDWTLEFTERSQWSLYKEMYEECYNHNIRVAYVKHIPIPGVHLIADTDDKIVEPHFVRCSSKYYRQVQSDVDMALDPSNVLYDMDNSDEEWISGVRICLEDGSKMSELTDEMFERVMDTFEKFAHAHKRDEFSIDEIDFNSDVGHHGFIKAIYEHWRQKRREKGLPLIRHFQPPSWMVYEKQVRDWEYSRSRVHSSNNGVACTVNKPPLFAFCLKPRGLGVPIRNQKQRSIRKLMSVAGHRSVMKHHNSVHTSGKSDKTINDGSERCIHPKKRGSDFQNMPFSQPKKLKTDDVNHSSTNINNFLRIDAEEQKLWRASSVAQQARKIAKLKRGRAEWLHQKADLAIQKATYALIIADAIKESEEQAASRSHMFAPHSERHFRANNPS